MQRDNLPYRCPRCGDHRNFNTLQELKVHLEVEHPVVSSKKDFGKLIDSYRKDVVKLEANRHRGERAKSLDRAKSRPKHPLHHPREHAVDGAGTPELGTKPKLNGHHDNLTKVPPPGGTRPSTNQRPGRVPTRHDPDRSTRAKEKLAELMQQAPELNLPRNINGMRTFPIPESPANPNGGEAPSISSDDLNLNLYRDLIKPNVTENGRSHIYVMADALLQARKHIDTMKQTAEKVTNEQEKAINKLKQDVKVKDHQLDRARKELYKLIGERRRLQRDVLDLSQTKDEDKQQLMKVKRELENQADLITDKEREVEDLTKYLHIVGEKESEAKTELENFIASLLDRAQTAEEQLRNLQTSLLLSRAASSNALDSPNKDSLPHSSEPNESQSDYPSNDPETNPLNGGGNLRAPFGGGFSSPKGIPGASYLGPPYSDFNESQSHPDELDRLPSDPNGIIWDDEYSPNAPENSHRKTRPHRRSKNLTSPNSPFPYRQLQPKNSSGNPHSWFSSPTNPPDYRYRKLQRIPTPDWTSESFELPDRRSSYDDLSGTSAASYNYNPSELSTQLRRQRDALFCVSMYVDTKTLCKMASVCREWLQVTRHPALWRRVALRHERISSKFLVTMSKWCTQLQSLTLEGLRGRQRRSNESNKSYKHIMRGSLELGVEHLFSVSHRTLVSLRVVNCGTILTDRIIWLAGSKTQNLQRLAYISDTDPLGSEAIWSLAAGCQNLTTLIVPPSYPCEQPMRFNNRSVIMIAKCWPGLRVLCLGGPEVSVKGLVAVSRHCRDLQVLELDHMCEVTETVAMDMCDNGLAHLECLDFTFTPVTPKALLYFVNACPRLKTINVHVGISDYFQDVSHPNHQQQYRVIVSKLHTLLRKPGMSGIIRLKTNYD